MSVDINTAEEIVNYGCPPNKKNAPIQKRMLQHIVEQVEQRRAMIQAYLLTVDVMTEKYHRKKATLEQLIHRLDDRGQTLDRGLQKISHQQKELERRQAYLEGDLCATRITAQKYLQKKARCEAHYNAVASVPLLSAQSKKRYLKARDKNLEMEQQVSEKREALDKCRAHLRLMSKTVSAQCTEQDQLCTQRRGSVDTITSSAQQLAYVKQGYEFWLGFDSYQAQVVLESALYLADLECQPKNNSKSDGLDVYQIWTKTFKLACFEYGDRVVYGDSQWNPETLKVDFDCDMCQTSQTGWPKVVEGHNLACDVCYLTSELPKALYVKEAPGSKSSISSLMQCHSGKMKKLMSNLFHHTNAKIDPIM